MKEHPILRSWLFYFGSLAILYGCYELLFYLDSFSVKKNHKLVFLLIGTYLILGFVLNIMINNKLINDSVIEYHEYTNTIGNIAKSKILSLVFWIISYPLLLIQLSIINFF
jgi:hypothetical protein